MTGYSDAPLREVRGPHNRALHAKRAIAKNELLFTESPLVSMQLPHSVEAAVACACCLRPVGTLATQLEHMTTARPPSASWSLPLDDDDDGALAPAMPCKGGCGAVFCSVACMANASSNGHALLCAAPGARTAHALAFEQFRAHAVSEWAGFFFFGAQIVCKVLHALLEQKPSASCPSSCKAGEPCEACVGRASTAFAPFCRGLWWEISDVDEQELTRAEAARARRELRACAQRSLELLHAVLRARGVDARLLRWLTLEEWGGLLGMARQNSLCVEVDNPLRDFVETLRGWHAGSYADGSGVGALLEALPQVPECVLGTALYDRIACFNHSCGPNAHIRFDVSGSHTAAVHATRPIASGEEVTI